MVPPPCARRDGVTDRAGVGDVEGERQHAVAVALRELGELPGLARRGDNAVTGIEGGTDERAAEAAGGTGDEPDLLHGNRVPHLVSAEHLSTCIPGAASAGCGGAGHRAVNSVDPV